MKSGAKAGRSGGSGSVGETVAQQCVKPGKPVPLSEWLTLMLAEIEQKGAESDVANDERKRRENDEL